MQNRGVSGYVRLDMEQEANKRDERDTDMEEGEANMDTRL